MIRFKIFLDISIFACFEIFFKWHFFCIIIICFIISLLILLFLIYYYLYLISWIQPISRRQTAYYMYIDDDNDLRLKFLSKFFNNLLLTSFALIPLLSVDSDQYLLDRQKSDLVNQMQACRIEKPKALFVFQLSIWRCCWERKFESVDKNTSNTHLPEKKRCVNLKIYFSTYDKSMILTSVWLKYYFHYILFSLDNQNKGS